MDTLYLTTAEADIARAADIIRQGGLVGFPTETVYGLGGNALDPQAAKAIYAAKGRPSDNPLIVHIAKVEEMEALAASVPENAWKLAGAIWPGPLTMVLPKRPCVPDETTGGLATVAIRCPADESARRLIELSGVPIAAPSANLSGRPSPTRWEHVKADLDGRIDALLCGNPCIGGIESTVLDLTDPDHPQVLRPGLITPERVTEVLGVPCTYDPAILGKPEEGLVPKAPGMKYKHYAPKADMTLFEGPDAAVRREIRAQAEALRTAGKQAAVLLYGSGEEAAAKLFADLRRLDEEGADVILAQALDGSKASVNYSVMNRMLKAAGYHIKEVSMKIALACDHGGYELKLAVMDHLKERGIECIDLGCNGERVDYPVYGKAVGEAVVNGEADLGIACCGTGLGISMAANKVHGVRCAVPTTPFMAEMAKAHNNANVLALGGRVLTPEQAIEYVDLWLDTEFLGDYHAVRVAMLDEM
ncbi:MAG: threonylcarbamoyl-AMP synthase [Firmicutes bacterium]|nr:threonylcarbamoyl-AMP synthase [Bacillota bacterium]